MSVKQTYSGIQSLRLDEIRPNPLNPRKKFEGPEFDQFCENIARVGVLQPILVRPFGDSGSEYEIVFGERRFKAACKIAEKNGGLSKGSIPAQVKNLSDDEALDLMTVENLQREDLTPWEEARGFQIYVERFGEDRIPDLAERVNMDPRYIRRRLALLKLPDTVLQAWDAGEIQTGHLQQFLRLEDKKQIAEYLELIIKYGKSVGEIKNAIDHRAPPLKWAKFDLAGCAACYSNSEVQKKLFDIDCEKAAKCINPKCFKKNQNNYFLKNWKKTGFYKRYHTTGFRFNDDIGYGYDKRHDFYDPAPEKCHACEHYVTLIDLDGTSKRYQRVCLGERQCFDEARRSGRQKQASVRKKGEAPPDPGTPRVSWHGTYFREKFFQAELPARIEQLTAGETLPDADIAVETAEIKADRLLLMNLVSANRELRDWFILRHAQAQADKWCIIYLDENALFAAIMKIEDPLALRREIRAASAQGILTRHFVESTRRLVSAHIGIELSKEWSITEEYLQKKTKAEMLAMGEKLGIFADEKAQAYLFEVLGKKRGKFTTCKGSELRDVFLKSGVELKGRVPDEILKDSGLNEMAEDIEGNPVDYYDPDLEDEIDEHDEYVAPGIERREYHGIRKMVSAGEMSIEDARAGYKKIQETTDANSD